MDRYDTNCVSTPDKVGFIQNTDTDKTCTRTLTVSIEWKCQYTLPTAYHVGPYHLLEICIQLFLLKKKKRSMMDYLFVVCVRCLNIWRAQSRYITRSATSIKTIDGNSCMTFLILFFFRKYFLFYSSLGFIRNMKLPVWHLLIWSLNLLYSYWTSFDLNYVYFESILSAWLMLI